LGYSSTKTGHQITYIKIPLFFSTCGWIILAIILGKQESVPLVVQYLTLLLILTTASAFVSVLWAWMSSHLKSGTTGVVSIGIINSVGNSSGLIAPIMTSVILEKTKSYGWVAGIAGIISFIGLSGVVMVNFVLRRYEEVPSEKEESIDRL